MFLKVIISMILSSIVKMIGLLLLWNLVAVDVISWAKPLTILQAIISIIAIHLLQFYIKLEIKR